MGDLDRYIWTMVVIVMVGGTFFLLRSVMCWYWKINQALYLQEYQVNLSKLILKELKTLNAENGKHPEQIDEKEGEPVPS